MVLEVGREEGGKLGGFQYILQRRYLQCHDVVERLWLSVNEKVLTFFYPFCTKYYLIFLKRNLLFIPNLILLVVIQIVRGNSKPGSFLVGSLMRY
jgi:hypothetical protein